jgi:hypothetical protein
MLTHVLLGRTHIIAGKRHRIGKEVDRRWEEGIARFREALAIDPDDGPSALYRERCTEFLKNPPDDNWDGIFTMRTK